MMDWACRRKLISTCSYSSSSRSRKFAKNFNFKRLEQSTELNELFLPINTRYTIIFLNHAMQPCSLKLPQTLSQVYNVWVWRYDIPLSNKPLFGKGWAVYCQNANIGQWWYYTIVFGTRSSSTGAALTLTLIENMKGDTPAKFPVRTAIRDD